MLASLGSTISVMLVRDSETAFPSMINSFSVRLSFPINPRKSLGIYVIVNSMEVTLETALVGVLATLILVESVAACVILIVLTRRMSSLESRVDRFGLTVIRFLEQFELKLDQLLPVVRRLPEWSRQVSKAAEKMTEATTRADATAAEGLGVLRENTRRLSAASNTMLAKFSKGTYVVHRSIIDPAHRLSAALLAIQSYISRLVFGGDDNNPSDQHPDNQIFI